MLFDTIIVNNIVKQFLNYFHVKDVHEIVLE